jgi:hypothetical protein
VGGGRGASRHAVGDELAAEQAGASPG